MSVVKKPAYPKDPPHEYLCLSADTKPTTNIPVYSTIFETDTGNVYIWNGSGWVVL